MHHIHVFHVNARPILETGRDGNDWKNILEELGTLKNIQVPLGRGQDVDTSQLKSDPRRDSNTGPEEFSSSSHWKRL